MIRIGACLEVRDRCVFKGVERILILTLNSFRRIDHLVVVNDINAKNSVFRLLRLTPCW